MSKSNNFMDDFQKDHSDLLKLIISFRKAVESSQTSKAKEILDEINNIANGHFNFEQTYLYPRLRRLILEITNSLGNEQQIMREFMKKSRDLLDKNKLNKNELSYILELLPRLSKFFHDCNDLVSLVKKFNQEDQDDLNRRFKECCTAKSLASV